MGVFMRDEGRMETEDIILGKAKYEDWRSIYRNVWSRPETAEYMVWKVTTDEGEARERIQRTIAWQETHDAWLVYERAAGRPLVLPEWRKQSRIFFMRLVLPWGRSMWEGDMGNRYCVYCWNTVFL